MDAKITMTIEEALELAVEALNDAANDTYDGAERGDPEIEAWIKKREAAASLIERQLKGIRNEKD